MSVHTYVSVNDSPFPKIPIQKFWNMSHSISKALAKFNDSSKSILDIHLFYSSHPYGSMGPHLSFWLVLFIFLLLHYDFVLKPSSRSSGGPWICKGEWPWTPYLPISMSQVPGLQAVQTEPTESCILRTKLGSCLQADFLICRQSIQIYINFLDYI